MSRCAGIVDKRRQRGVAIITAMLLTALAITIVASLFWQQQVQVRSMENQRLQLQTKWILRGALDWARLILREDKRYSSVDHMGEPWAVTLADTRLDDYIEKSPIGGDSTDASLSGNIVDAQARYNLCNLARNGMVDPIELAILRRLLINLNQKPELAERIAAMVVASSGGSTAAGTSTTSSSTSTTSSTSSTTSTGTGTSAGNVEPTLMPMTQIDDLLAVPGLSVEVRDRLQDHVAFLPVSPTKINVNTASPEVLAAVMPLLSMADARALVLQRDRAYFKNIADFKARMHGKAVTLSDSIATETDFFFVVGRVKLDRASLQTLALLQRNINTSTVVWVREN